MDNVRLFLFMALAFLGMLLYQAWQTDYGPAARQAATEQTVQPTITGVDTPDAPARADIDAAAPSVPTVGSTAEGNSSRLLKVHTDSFDLVIDTRGGTIVDARLVKYPVAVNKPDEKYRLLSQRPTDFFIAQSGLLGPETDRTPTHEAVFTASAESFSLKDGEDTLDIDLLWQSPDGLTVTKRFTFRRGSHAVQLQHMVNNGSDKPWSGREYRQLQRGEPEDSGKLAILNKGSKSL